MCPYVPLCAPGLRASPSQELISRPASQNRSAPELKTVISKKYQWQTFTVIQVIHVVLHVFAKAPLCWQKLYIRSCPHLLTLLQLVQQFVSCEDSCSELSRRLPTAFRAWQPTTVVKKNASVVQALSEMGNERVFVSKLLQDYITSLSSKVLCIFKAWKRRSFMRIATSKSRQTWITLHEGYKMLQTTLLRPKSCEASVSMCIHVYPEEMVDKSPLEYRTISPIRA